MADLMKLGKFAWGIIFLCVWGTFVVVDHFAVGMSIPYLIEDIETGWFSISLNWLTLEPRVWSHHPSPFFNQIGGLVTIFLDQAALSNFGI